jgi:hypothetical protein
MHEEHSSTTATYLLLELPHTSNWNFNVYIVI